MFIHTSSMTQAISNSETCLITACPVRVMLMHGASFLAGCYGCTQSSCMITSIQTHDYPSKHALGILKFTVAKLSPSKYNVLCFKRIIYHFNKRMHSIFEEYVCPGGLAFQNNTVYMHSSTTLSVLASC